MSQLAKQLAKKSTSNFVTNTGNNPKEECKTIFTRSKRRESAEKRAEGVLKDVSNEEGEDKKREDGEKEKSESKESGDEVLTTKTKSQLVWEARKEIPSVLVKEIPYPLVPSKKDNE